MTTPPIVDFHKGHGTEGEEHVHEGIETLDKGFISIGHTQDLPESKTTDMLVIKTDSVGEEIWSKKVGGIGEWDVGIAIAEASDSFYAVGGKSLGGIQKPAVIKLTKEGEILWEKIFDTPGVGLLRGVDINQDGKIVVTGFHGGDEEGFVFISEASGFAAALDGDGEVVWKKDYQQIPQGTKILSTESDGYAILSTIWNDEENNAAILKIGDSGEVEWFKSYGGGHNQAFDFEYIPQEGYVLAGHTNSISAVNWDGLMTKVDTSGNLVWRRTVGQPRGYDPRYIHDEFYGIVVDSDGSYVMAGGTGDETGEYEEDGHPSGPSGEWKSYLVKINSNGDVVWEEVYGENNEGHNAAEFLDTTYDGGFILFNDSDNESISQKAPNNFGFMKLRSTGSDPDSGEGDGDPVDNYDPDLNEDGFVDGITNYQMWTASGGVDLTNRGGRRRFSDTTSRIWNAEKAVQLESDFSILIKHERKHGKYKIWSSNSDGIITSKSRWKSGDQMMSEGFEDLFELDLNGDSIIGKTPIQDQNDDGFVDAALNYQVYTADDREVYLRNKNGRRIFSDTTSAQWDAVKVITTDSVINTLIEGTARKDGKFKIWSSNFYSGNLRSQTRWKREQAMVNEGYESVFNYDINDNGFIGS